MATKSSIIYARVSTAAQDYDRQVNDLTNYAMGNGYDIVKVFCEKISGAKKNEERPALMEALDFATTNGHTILCSEMSRLGRSTWEVLEAVKRCVDTKTDIYFMKESMHLLDADGNENIYTPVIISVLGMAAKLEKEAIRFRMKSGYDNYRAAGNKVGRKTGFSFKYEDYQKKHPELVKDLYDKEKGVTKGRLYSVRSLAERYNLNPSTVQAITLAVRKKIEEE